MSAIQPARTAAHFLLNPSGSTAVYNLGDSLYLCSGSRTIDMHEWNNCFLRTPGISHSSVAVENLVFLNLGEGISARRMWAF